MKNKVKIKLKLKTPKIFSEQRGVDPNKTPIATQRSSIKKKPHKNKGGLNIDAKEGWSEESAGNIMAGMDDYHHPRMRRLFKGIQEILDDPSVSPQEKQTFREELANFAQGNNELFWETVIERLREHKLRKMKDEIVSIIKEGREDAERMRRLAQDFGDDEASSLSDRYDERYGEEEEIEGPLYHVTFIRVLDSIARNGLVPGSKSNFSSGYDAHSRGRVFMCRFDQVPYWANKMEEIAEHSTDNPEQGWTPVVLRVDIRQIQELIDDELGNDDTNSSDNFYSEQAVPPKFIEVWTGARWESVEDVDAEDLNEIALNHAEYVEEDDMEWYEMDYGILIPHEG